MTPEAVRWILSQSLPLSVMHSLGGPEYLAETLAPLGEEALHAVVAEIPALWPVSQILTMDILQRMPRVLERIETEEIHEWVSGALERYEATGLAGARRYLDDVERRPQGFRSAAGGPGFAELRNRLELYLSGLAGRRISVEEGAGPATDGVRILLPETLGAGRGQDLLFKYAVTVQWAATRFGTFLLPGPKRFFSTFPNPSLAVYLWNMLETARLEERIRRRLPGLVRDMESLRNDAGGGRLPGRLRNVRECLRALAAAASSAGEAGIRKEIDTVLEGLGDSSSTIEETGMATRRLCAALGEVRDLSAFPEAPPYALRIEPGAFDAVRLELRKILREEFVDNLASIFLATRDGDAGGGREETETAEGMSPSGDSGRVTDEIVGLLVEAGKDGERESSLGAETILRRLPAKVNPELMERLREMEAQIRDDLGALPREYVSAAQGMAGRGRMMPGMPGHPDVAEPEQGQGRGEAVYDEWDARRNGYRKNWCRVVELEPAVASGNFVENTITTHYGTVQTLRRQFELLRRRDRFVKRQRDGDDIDLDAGIEALTDMMVGHSPSERVFVRLLRDERDIATLFLVDMSASTEGWVSTTIKESLVLLCEALERLGDRYGIFGFSGMRRTRSEWYPIKQFDEPYDETVKARVTGIVPRDYTRMGPAIRHGTRLLGFQENRTRILLTLSDGKPEDYDDYKGDYAIEDTRKALIEARYAGVHPFCITVDREARDYLPHMFGMRDYAVVHDVRLRPSRLPEIYRAITT